MNVAQLTIEMAANVARLREDMARATSTVDGAMTKIRASADGAMRALGALGLGLSVAGLAGFVRTAIDAADEMSKLGQKAGLAAEEIAGLQLAFGQAGAGDQFAGAMARLAKEVAGGNDQLAAMGVATKNADGSLRSSREVLGDVAGKFAGYRDGIEKTAAAQAIFGKSGADLIPLLNGGAEALDEYDQKAQALGLTLTDDAMKAAEQFNDQLDLVFQASQGLGRQLATELLPTLNNITAAMLEAQGPTNSLAGALGGALTTVLQTVAVLANNLVFVLRGIYGEISAIVRQIGALATLDFAKFTQIGADWTEQARQLRAAADAFDKRVMGNGQAPDAKEQPTAGKSVAPVVNKGTANAANAAKKAAEEYANLVKRLNSDLVSATAEAEGAQHGYNAAQIEFLKMAASPEWEKYLPKQREELALLLDKKAAQELATAALKAEAEQQQESMKVNADTIEAAQKAAASLEEQVVQQRAQVEAIGLTSVAIAALEAAKLQEQATSKDRLATLADELDATGALGDSYRAQAISLRELAKLKQSGAAKEVAVEEAKKATEEWKKFTDQVNSSLTDSLMRAFESGEGFFKTFWSSIKNMFKTTVLKMLVQPVVGRSTVILWLSLRL